MAYYKYREFSENHIAALTGNKLIFARGDTFNDPFDSQPPVNVVTFDSMAHVVRQRPMSHLLNELQFKTIVQNQVDEVRDMLDKGKIREHEIWQYFDLIIQSVCRRFIFCLSMCNTNILMWSHYSSSHEGFCVRFNLDVLCQELPIFHHDNVTYCNELSDVLLAMMQDSHVDLAKDLLFQKSKDWKYEKEYRLILNDYSNDKKDKYREIEYPENAIDRIYFGMEAKNNNIGDLMGLLSGRDIEFYQMKRAKSAIGVYAYKI